MTGQVGAQVAQAASSIDAQVRAATLTRNAGIAATASANSFNSNRWNNQATDHASFHFTITSGYTLDLTRVKVDTQSSATGPGTMGLFYSGDNFTTSLGSVTQPSASLVNASIDVALLPLLAGTVEFRFR
jgi:hypothetical protein